MIGYRPYIRRVVVCFITTLLVFTTTVPPLSAQHDLERISISERSDGLGYVVRYHLSEPVDSFKVYQPEADLIQMKLFSQSLDASLARMPEPESSIQDVQLHNFPNGYGIDIRLEENRFFKADVYPDQNRQDLLLALTKSSEESVTGLAEKNPRINWHRIAFLGDEEDDSTFLNGYLNDENYVQIRENLNFDTIVIDAGHGGRDPGTIGYRGIREKNITLAVALKLGEYIEEYMPDVKVVYTRESDKFVELEKRGQIANQARGDLFVSIHANATARNPTVQGAEVYFLGLARTQSALEVMKRENSVVRFENGNGFDELSEEDLLIYELANAGNIAISERIAEKVEYQFRERAQRRSRGVKQAQFVVLYHASMPALLVELGFITNPSEAQFLESEYGQAIVASALFRAIRDYRDEYERSRNLTRSN